MRGKIFYGLLLIAAMLLAGTAWGDDAPVSVAGSDAAVQGDVRNEMPDGGDTALPATESAGKDVLTDYDEATPKEETAPPVQTTPAAENPSQSEGAAEAGAETTDDVSPESGVAEDEAGSEEVAEEVTIADPIEPWNRLWYHFNDKLYFWAMKPAAQGYNFVVPEPVRVSVRDFFRNVAMPVRFVSSLLQGKIKGAGTEIARFGINTTLGVAGFFDVAKSWFDLNPSEEDLGQTLGSYGMGGMMYIVWPFLGPSTVRDTIGFAGDSFLDPINYLNPFYVPPSIHAYEKINTTSLDLKSYEELKESSIEPYTALRDAYIQHRKAMIKK
jgi:phospholipid-binding lipoprotein MlaA